MWPLFKIEIRRNTLITPTCWENLARYGRPSTYKKTTYVTVVLFGKVIYSADYSTHTPK